jgi:hypothetical protein
VRYLPHLSELRNLVCPGDLTPLDPVAAMPGLRRLELIQNSVLRDLGPLAAAPALEILGLTWCTSLRDLSPLAPSRTLRTLQLTGCSLLRDLSSLAASTIVELDMHLMSCDLDSLSGAPLTSLTIRDRRLADGMHVLPAGLPLRRLTLDNLPADRNLRGVERWQDLEELAFSGLPGAEEISALTHLPQLRRITLTTTAPAPADATSPDPLDSLRHALPHVEIITPAPQPPMQLPG